MRSARPFALWVAAGVVVAALAFFAGRSLHANGGATASFTLDAPAYTVPQSAAGYSKAGFSGFTETPAEGLTVLAGRVVTTTSDSITVESAGGQRSSIRLSGSGPMLRLEPDSRDSLRPGVTVIVRREANDAAAILSVSQP
jgi:hypothetical protein